MGLLRGGGGLRALDRVNAEIAAALAADPSNKEALLAECESLLRQRKDRGRSPTARTDRRGRRWFRCATAAGRSLASQAEGDEKKAGGSHRRAGACQKLDPDRSEPYERLAVIYEKRGQKEASLRELQAAVRLDIMDPELATRTLAKLHAEKAWAGGSGDQRAGTSSGALFRDGAVANWRSPCCACRASARPKRSSRLRSKSCASKKGKRGREQRRTRRRERQVHRRAAAQRSPRTLRQQRPSEVVPSCGGAPDWIMGAKVGDHARTRSAVGHAALLLAGLCGGAC